MVEIIAKLSGFSLAALTYENFDLTDKYGLLIGYTNEELIKTVTDAEMENIEHKKYVNITGVYPLTERFFKNIGNIIEPVLTSFIATDIKNIVGWYHFRANTDPKLTVREKLIHKNLCNFVSMPVDLFICCIPTVKYSNNAATHTLTHVFYRYDYVNFLVVPVTIPNLGDTYQGYKFKGPTSQTATINKIIKESIDPVSPENSLKKMKDGIKQHIDKLIEEICSVENQIEELKSRKKGEPCEEGEESDEVRETLTPKITQRLATSTPSTPNKFNKPPVVKERGNTPIRVSSRAKKAPVKVAERGIKSYASMVNSRTRTVSTKNTGEDSK